MSGDLGRRVTAGIVVGLVVGVLFGVVAPLLDIGHLIRPAVAGVLVGVLAVIAGEMAVKRAHAPDAASRRPDDFGRK